MNPTRLSSAPFAGLMLLLAPALTAAATPDVELLRLTPPDAHFVVLVKDLRTHFAQVSDGPFAQTLRASTVGNALAASPEFAKLESVARELGQALGVEWGQVRDDLIGDAVVYAYSGGPPAHPEQERGLLLTWARDPKLATKLFERLDQVQKESGELKEVRALSHQGVGYVQRVKTKGADEFFVLRGSVLAVSSQENAIRGMIEADARISRDVLPPLARELDRVQARDAFVSVWVNSRRFGAELDERVALAKGPEAAFLAAFARCWKALDGVAISCKIDRHLEINLNAAVDRDRFPPALLKAAGAFNEPSSLSAVFPADALFATTGRLDLPAAIEALGDFMTLEGKRALFGSMEQGLAPVIGKKYLALLPTHLGPDWGVCITAPASAQTAVPDMVAAVRIQPGEGREMEKRILDACDAAVTLLRMQYNGRSDEPIRLDSIREQGVEIKYLTHVTLFPPGVRPAYGVRNGYLLVATSPEAILKLDFSRASKPAGPARLLIVSFRGWLNYLKSRPDVAKYLPGNVEETTGQLAKLSTVLELLDRLEVVNESTQPGQMKLSAKLYFTQPVKK